MTGASGLLGSHLVPFLISNDWNVSIIQRANTNTWRIRKYLSDINVLESNNSDYSDVIQKVADLFPKHIVHLGWYGVENRHRNNFENEEV